MARVKLEFTAKGTWTRPNTTFAEARDWAKHLQSHALEEGFRLVVHVKRGESATREGTWSAVVILRGCNIWLSRAREKRERRLREFLQGFVDDLTCRSPKLKVTSYRTRWA